MDLKRLGSMHQSRLSFMRFLVRRMMQEKWQVSPTLVELDEHGYGCCVYKIVANQNTYSYVLFSQYIADEERDDRVIADKWDVTMALCIGDVDKEQLEQLRRNVPKQERGRYDSQVMVLSRGNKSSRNFAHVVDELAAGRQPSMQQLAKVGYLYRTTAVYGSGKFGMADWEKVRQACPEFAHPFAAEMFNCFMLRHFSIDQAEHLARIKSPDTAVGMAPEVARFLGIGNATGLGMAPYLVRHPQIISQWVLMRETVLARVLNEGEVNAASLDRLISILQRAQQHFRETRVSDDVQTSRNDTLCREIVSVLDWLSNGESVYCEQHSDWHGLSSHVAANMSLETQELVNSALLELYPELVDEGMQYPCVDEVERGEPAMTVAELVELIEHQYDWALAIDFDQQDANHYFWYRSEEKMEPRLGERFNEPGAEKEMPLVIARRVRDCYDRLLEFQQSANAKTLVAFFIAQQPELAGIVKRIQTMAQECYGEIRANLADKDMLPLDLLRCKLSFFGVSKFDPKSKLWVRNTMFQGAPLLFDIGKPFIDDWYFPVAESG